MKTTTAIETARIKDVTKEQVFHFDGELHRIIREHHICLEDVFNTDETGFQPFQCPLIIGYFVGTAQTSNFIVDISVFNAYEGQPGQQESVIVNEGISAIGAISRGTSHAQEVMTRSERE